MSQEVIPDRLYKYRSMSGQSAEWVERIILRNELYFAPAASFNDPFDLKPVFSLKSSPAKQREDYLRLSRKFQPHLTEAEHQKETELVMANGLSPENIEHTASIIQMIHHGIVSDQVGVFCVSTLFDHILMWSHYADSHRGVCLEFDGSFDLMANVQKVKYRQDRSPINPYLHNNLEMSESALLVKSEHWSYESEWRLLRVSEGPGVVAFDPKNLTGIIIGAMADSHTVEKVLKWNKQRSTPLRVSRAWTSNSKFELEIHPYLRG